LTESEQDFVEEEQNLDLLNINSIKPQIGQLELKNLENEIVKKNKIQNEQPDA
jgi:hypothetical protein